MKPLLIAQLAIAAGTSLALVGPVVAQTEAEDNADAASEIEEILVAVNPRDTEGFSPDLR